MIKISNNREWTEWADEPSTLSVAYTYRPVAEKLCAAYVCDSTRMRRATATSSACQKN